MQKLIRRFAVWLVLAGWICSLGCASIKSNAAVCQIRFDYQDMGIESLNDQNLRALLAFKEVCE